MQYRRATTPGATYFFIVVTYNRQHLFKIAETIQLLRQAFHIVNQRYPFDIDAIVLPNDWGADGEIMFSDKIGWK